MNLAVNLAVRLVALLLALAPAAAQDAAARVVQRRFASEVELATERFEVTGKEGETSEKKHMPPQVRQQADEIEIVDTWFSEGEPSEEGGEAGAAPEAFERLYATVQTTFDVGRERAPHSKTARAGLEGKTVRFERERDGTYARRCDDPDARPVQLRRLRAELSLAPFLPASGADAQESWELPLAELGRLVSPLESEVRRPRPKDETSTRGLSVAPSALAVPIGALLSAAEGTLTATRLADDEAEALPRRARLEFRLTATHDGSATLLAGRAGESEDELRLAFQGAGTLAWDPARGAIEITLEGEARLEETFRTVIEGNGATAEIEGELVMSGTLSFEGREQPGE